jgi:hypothetical protein
VRHKKCNRKTMAGKVRAEKVPKKEDAVEKVRQKSGKNVRQKRWEKKCGKKIAEEKVRQKNHSRKSATGKMRQ